MRERETLEHRDYPDEEESGKRELNWQTLDDLVNGRLTDQETTELIFGEPEGLTSDQKSMRETLVAGLKEDKLTGDQMLDFCKSMHAGPQQQVDAISQMAWAERDDEDTITMGYRAHGMVRSRITDAIMERSEYVPFPTDRFTNEEEKKEWIEDARYEIAGYVYHKAYEMIPEKLVELAKEVRRIGSGVPDHIKRNEPLEYTAEEEAQDQVDAPIWKMYYLVQSQERRATEGRDLILREREDMSDDQKADWSTFQDDLKEDTLTGDRLVKFAETAAALRDVSLNEIEKIMDRNDSSRWERDKENYNWAREEVSGGTLLVVMEKSEHTPFNVDGFQTKEGIEDWYRKTVESLHEIWKGPNPTEILDQLEHFGREGMNGGKDPEDPNSLLSQNSFDGRLREIDDPDGPGARMAREAGAEDFKTMEIDVDPSHFQTRYAPDNTAYETTPGVRLQVTKDAVDEALARFQEADWGEASKTVQEENDKFDENGYGPVIGQYSYGDATFWIRRDGVNGTPLALLPREN